MKIFLCQGDSQKALPMYCYIVRLTSLVICYFRSVLGFFEIVRMRRGGVSVVSHWPQANPFDLQTQFLACRLIMT